VPEWSYHHALKNRRLAVLLCGIAVSSVGDGMLIVALPLEALKIHGRMPAAFAMSLTIAAPYILSTCLAMAVSLGRLRFPLKPQIVVDCLLRGTTFSALGVAAIGEHLGLAMLLISLLLGSSLRSLANGAARLAATGTVPAEGRYAVNGLLATINNFALYIAGPSVGGLVTAVIGPGWALLCNGISFFLLLVVVLVAVLRKSTMRVASARPFSGLALLKNHPIAWRLLVIVFAFNLLYMPVETSLPLLINDALGGSAGALGAIWTGFGIGALVGAFATNYLRSISRRSLLIGIIAFWGCAMLVLGLATSMLAVAIIFVCAGIGYAPFTPVAYSYIQSFLSGPEEQPVITFWATISALAAPLGLVAAGPLVNALGARGGLMVSALTTIALALAAMRVLRSSVLVVRSSDGDSHHGL
jgi:Major Facilitator Superfamily